MVDCLACHTSVQPIHEMGQDMRPRELCSRCKAPIVRLAAVAPSTAAPRILPAAPVCHAPPGSILEMAKARLAEVTAQLGELHALEAEASMLDRMIAAAEAAHH